MRNNNFNFNNEQEAALRVLESGNDIFLTGEGGTGKSSVLNNFIERHQDDKNILVCAPTGIAAINVGGVTLHRTFKIPVDRLAPGDYNIFPPETLKSADTIIVDEISMCRRDIFEYIMLTIQHIEKECDKHIQLITVGDFYQLSPFIVSKDKQYMKDIWGMKTDNDAYAFKSNLWSKRHFSNIVLRKVMRQYNDADNNAFKQNLNKIRQGDVSAIPWFESNVSHGWVEDSIYLCGKNSTAQTYNLERVFALNAPEKHYKAITEGSVSSTDKMTEDDLIIKKGLRVMTLVNVGDEYQNGSIGTVEDYTDESISVRLDSGKLVEVHPYTWEIYDYKYRHGHTEKVVIGTFTQFPLKYAYAITIHKSQGQTYDSVNLDATDCWANGQLYVGLSRVRDIHNLCLNTRIQYSAVKTAQCVKDFYAKIDKEIEEFGQEIFSPDADLFIESVPKAAVQDKCTTNRVANVAQASSHTLSSDSKPLNLYLQMPMTRYFGEEYERNGNKPYTPEFPKIPNVLEKNYYIAIDGQPYGPYSTSDLADYIITGQLDQDVLVYEFSLENWIHASEAPELKEFYASLLPAIPVA